MTTLWLPPKKEEPPQRTNDTHVFNVYREQDIENFQKICNRHGAFFCGHVRVPFWNQWGQQVGLQYALIYQHTEELEMEVLC